MKQLLSRWDTGQVWIEEVPVPTVKKEGLLVKNVFSCVSPGTEKAISQFGEKSWIGKMKARPDLTKKMWQKIQREGLRSAWQGAQSKLQVPVSLGYSCAGIVVEVGEPISEFQIGDRVLCVGQGFASHSEFVSVPRQLSVKIPENVSFEEASFGALGAIAMHATRLAQLPLGSQCAVIGLGIVGLLTVQILKASGCRVAAIDTDSQRVQSAQDSGAEKAWSREEDLESLMDHWTQHQGVDAVFITAATSSNDPIDLASLLTREKGKVVVVGDCLMKLPRNLFYKKELELVVSRSYGPGRYDFQYEEKGIDYPFAYVRWTERRNLVEFLRLLSSGSVTPRKFVTHLTPIDQAPSVYAKFKTANGEKPLGVLISYNGHQEIERKKEIQNFSEAPLGPKEGQVGVALIGAGQYANSVLIPALKKLKNVRLEGVVTETGFKGKWAGKKWGFRYASTDVNQVLEDPFVQAVFIATQHDSHAELVERALKHQKAVFVEKPLALNTEELEKIRQIHQETKGRVMVGFNRRFSPHVQRIQQFFNNDRDACSLIYTIHAGKLPKESWIRDSAKGGGRILGEVCHFVDCANALIGSQPIGIKAVELSKTGESVVILISYANGSAATIHYLEDGNTQMGKERIEMHGMGKSIILEDFKRTTLFHNRQKQVFKTRTTDKGHQEELRQFVNWIEKGGMSPNPFEQSLKTTELVFDIFSASDTNREKEI